MANTYTQPARSLRISGLVRDNIVRIGIVLLGMTVFIAAAEAKTPINDVTLDDLPQLITQIANQSAAAQGGRIDTPMIARQFLASDDYAAQVAPSNLLNSPAARFLAERLD